MHSNAIEPRFGMAYSINDKTMARLSAGIFHNRVTLNDSTVLGGNPPFQPMVTVANGVRRQPGRRVGASTDLPFGINAQDTVFKHPTAYTWAAGVQREVPLGFVVDVTYVGRKGRYLQREFNINQLPAGTIQANPGVNIAALRPYKGYGAIRLSENSGKSIYNSLQVSADRRYSNGFKLSIAYTLGKSMDDGSNKRDVVFNTYDDASFYGPSSFDRRHVLGIGYIYDLPFWKEQETLLKNLLGGWQISGASFFRTGTPFSVLRTNDIAGVGDGAFGQPYNLVGDPKANATRSSRTAPTTTSGSTRRRSPRRPTAPSATRRATCSTTPGSSSGTLRSSRTSAWAESARLQFRAEIFNFPNHPNLGNAQTGTVTGGGAGFADPTNANFGRVTTKTNDRRDIQLSLRFVF